MSHRRKHNGRGANSVVHAGEVSRRAMVAGTVATTAVAAVLPLATSAYAQGTEFGHDGVPAAVRGSHWSSADKL